MRQFRRFQKQLGATPAPKSFGRFLIENGAAAVWNSKCQVYWIQTTRPVCMVTRTLFRTDVFVSKVFASSTVRVTGQLETILKQTAQTLKNKKRRMHFGSFLLPLGWKFELFLLGRYCSDSKLSFWKAVGLATVLPWWKLCWNFSKANRIFLET